MMLQLTKGLGNFIKCPNDGLLVVKKTFQARFLSSAKDERKILIGTHHKALTVFFSRIFKTYAFLLGREISISTSNHLNYSADILFDHHSRFNPELLPKKYWGIHVVRDPRDLLVSSAFYHKTSSEKWLHIQNNNLNGKTYQEHINSLPNIEEIILFEIDNQGGCNIQDMLNWNYQQPQFLEFRFEDLISEKGADFFNRSLQQISLNDRDIDLLNILFANYSIGGAWVKKKHVRNPTPKQWKRYFTKSVEQKFNEKFPNAVQMLGYNEE